MTWLAPWLLFAKLTASFAAECPPMDRLVTGANTGTLSADTRACLTATAQADGPIADRLTASRLLIANAFGSGARTDWAGHVRYHLEHLDRDDADLAVKYSAHLLKFGAPTDAVAWAEHALEHRYAWDGREDRDDRLYDALAARTRAGLAMLAALPEAAPELERSALEARVRLFAVEWLVHNTRARRDPTEPLAACATAGWDAAACKERAAELTPPPAPPTP